MAREIIHSHLGYDVVLEKITQSMTGYIKWDETNVKVRTTMADDQLVAYVYLKNTVQDKYRSVLKGLNSQKGSKERLVPQDNDRWKQFTKQLYIR